VRTPGAARVVLVEPDGGGDRLPEPLDVRAAEHGFRPAGGRVRRDRPAHPVAERDANALGGQISRPRDRDTVGVDVVEETRRRIAGERDQRAAALLDVGRATDQRGCSALDLLDGSELDRRGVDELVPVVDVDAGRSRLVARACDRPYERCVLDERVDVELLAFFEIDADVDQQLG